ncbi:ADP-ribosyltransferase [Nonomuraea sp. NPDC005650]|uniref:ADP-ribosyltransferase n=1 Tax=Nonomuraea sp. NPDC005650 TaxID=3157045 RepID=UPI0033B2DD98
MGQLEGMVPDGVRALKAALHQAEVSLDSIGEELWNILRGAWLPTAGADTIRQTAAWAGSQGPEINRRLVLLERMELVRPELFGAGKPPISVDEAMLAPGAPLPTAGNVWDRIGQELQDIFDPNLVSANPMAEQAKGAVESVAGLGQMLIDYSPTRAAIDFMGWQRSVNDMTQSLMAAVQNPAEFGKALLDWDTWASNPDRAFGRLIPDILAAVASAGSSSTASAGTRAVGALGRAAKNTFRRRPLSSPTPSELGRIGEGPPLLRTDGRAPGAGGRPHGTARPSDGSAQEPRPGGNGPAGSSASKPTAPVTNPLEDALRHHTNADGRAWARDHMPLPDLTKEELRALEFYGGPGYLKINPGLRAQAADPAHVLDPDVADHIAAMDQAIAKSHLPSDVVLHRGVNKGFLEALGVDIKSPAEMEALEGAVITEPGYLSTSVGRRGGFDGDVRVMLRVPKGYDALNMYPITGLFDEREILLRRGTSYIVRDVYRKDGQWYMEADVVPEGWTKPPGWSGPPSMDADLGWKGPPDD